MTKRNIIAVITATQLLETCWEGGAGLLPHAIGPFTHGNLVVLHCVPLTDLRKVKKELVVNILKREMLHLFQCVFWVGRGDDMAVCSHGNTGNHHRSCVSSADIIVEQL